MSDARTVIAATMAEATEFTRDMVGPMAVGVASLLIVLFRLSREPREEIHGAQADLPLPSALRVPSARALGALRERLLGVSPRRRRVLGERQLDFVSS